MTSKTTDAFSDEVRERGADGDGPCGAFARAERVVPIAEKIGCSAQSLHEWVKKAEVDSGKRAGVPTEMAHTLKSPAAAEPGAAAGRRDPAAKRRPALIEQPPAQLVVALHPQLRARKRSGTSPI